MSAPLQQPVAVAAVPVVGVVPATTTTTSNTTLIGGAPAVVATAPGERRGSAGLTAKEAKANEKELHKLEKEHEKDLKKQEKLHEKEVKQHEKDAAKAAKEHEKEVKKHEKEASRSRGSSVDKDHHGHAATGVSTAEDKKRRKSLAAEEKKLDKERRAAEEAARKARTTKFRAEEEATRARLRADVAAWDLRHLHVTGAPGTHVGAGVPATGVATAAAVGTHHTDAHHTAGAAHGAHGAHGAAAIRPSYHEQKPDNLEFSAENVGLFVAVARGRNLVGLDLIKSDPYVRVLLTSPAVPIHGTQHGAHAAVHPGGVAPAPGAVVAPGHHDATHGAHPIGTTAHPHDPAHAAHAAHGGAEVVHASHQSHHIRNNLNPEWYFHVDDTPHLLTDNHDWLQHGRLRIEVWDHDLGKDEHMGYIEFSLAELDGKVTYGDFALQLDESKAGKKARRAATLGDIYVEIRYRSPSNQHQIGSHGAVASHHTYGVHDGSHGVHSGAAHGVHGVHGAAPVGYAVPAGTVLVPVVAVPVVGAVGGVPTHGVPTHGVPTHGAHATSGVTTAVHPIGTVDTHHAAPVGLSAAATQPHAHYTPMPGLGLAGTAAPVAVAPAHGAPLPHH